MEFLPYPGHTLIFPLPEPESTGSGLALVEETKIPNYCRGRVLTSDPEISDICGFAPGDVVLYHRAYATMFRVIDFHEKIAAVPTNKIFAVTE